MLDEFYLILKKAGLPRIRFHDLRHTAASLMLNNNVSILVVSYILGYSRPSVTHDVYGRLLLKYQDEASLLIDQLVTPVLVDI